MLILLNFGLNQDVAKNFKICDCCKFPCVYTDALTHKQIQEGNEIIHWYKRQLVRDIKNFDCKSHIHYSPYELAFPSLTPTTTLPITITRNKIFQDTKKVKKCTKCCFPELILFKTILALFCHPSYLSRHLVIYVLSFIGNIFIWRKVNIIIVYDFIYSFWNTPLLRNIK